MKYIIAVDQSTTTTKSVLVDTNGALINACILPHKQYYPQPGFVEHDPEELYANTLQVIHDLLKKHDVKQEQLLALAITNQRETTVVWDKTTGKPVCNAMVWQCLRSQKICEELIKQGYDAPVKEKTGYLIVPSPPAGKIKWVLDHVEGARQTAEAGNLLFGSVDAWLLWKLTGGKVHATDYSNASRSLLYNINTLEWDQEILEWFTIPASMLPEVKYADEIFGYTALENGFTREIPIAGLMGDSHAALFGQNCFEEGMAKATYGTGSSIMMNIGKQPKPSYNGLVTSIGWGRAGTIDYVFEGNVNYTGSTLQWLKEDLELIPDQNVSEELAVSTASNEGVYLVPAFTGLGAPYWDNDARAAILGMSRNTQKAHVVRAALEAITYQIKDIVDLMLEQANLQLEELRVDGGPTRNDFLMQFQADMVDVPVVVAGVEELSALGSAYMAGLAVGVWKDLDELSTLRKVRNTFSRTMNPDIAQQNYGGWKEAINRILTNK